MLLITLMNRLFMKYRFNIFIYESIRIVTFVDYLFKEKL